MAFTRNPNVTRPKDAVLPGKENSIYRGGVRIANSIRDLGFNFQLQLPDLTGTRTPPRSATPADLQYFDEVLRRHRMINNIDGHIEGHYELYRLIEKCKDGVRMEFDVARPMGVGRDDGLDDGFADVAALAKRMASLSPPSAPH